jgi:hypothetical protein
MATKREDREAHSLRRVAEEQEQVRGERRGVRMLLVTCLLAAALGLFLVMWSAHTSNSDYGHIALAMGVLVGGGGILAMLICVWYRSHGKLRDTVRRRGY